MGLSAGTGTGLCKGTRPRGLLRARGGIGIKCMVAPSPQPNQTLQVKLACLYFCAKEDNLA